MLVPPELSLEQIDRLAAQVVESLDLVQSGSIGSFLKFRGPIGKSTTRLVGLGLRHLGYRTKPAFLIIGTQKGGTHALRHYLAAHPLLVGPKTSKEPHFFDQDRQYRRGIARYSQLFALPRTLRDGSQTFESTSSYMYYPIAAGRIHHLIPHVKLIILLREPIRRAFSAWNMFREFHASPNQIIQLWCRQFDPTVLETHMSFLSRDPFPDFGTAVREELSGVGYDTEIALPGLIARGFYDEQLDRIFALFGRDQVLVLQSSRLRSRPREVLDQTVDFLGLPRFEWPDHLLVPHNALGYVDTIETGIQSMLTEVFRPHNERLFELLGADLGWNRAP